MARMNDPLALFSDPVARWFHASFDRLTPPQAQGWPVIARGEHALIVSPTGSGKTLTAFLWSIDRLFRELRETPEPDRGARIKSDYCPGVRIVYVSPLKALNNDVERNLQAPIAGIQSIARGLGVALPHPRIAVRTGDTPSNERQKMLRRPPQVLITTPESLYLMLTSERARMLFATTHTVILDEIHTLVGTKRGAHLAVSIERLNRLTEVGLQRIGLSATVRPLEGAARFLGGQDPTANFAPRPVSIVDASYAKPLDLKVLMPLDDFRERPGESSWTAIVPELARLIDRHRTTLVFCNNRRLAERTAERLNEQRLHERSAGQDGGIERQRFGKADLGSFAAGIDSRVLEAAGVPPIRAHHGSTSKSARLEMEQALKSGQLPALVCTSSLELGIDVGEIDLVVNLQSPKSVASGLQRVGRAGHRVGQTSVGRIFPTHADDLIEAAAVSRGMLRGEIEESRPPENPLDVLAQQIVAMVSVEGWSVDDALKMIRSANPFRDLSETVFRSVLEMLSGKYPESISRQLRALIAWDRVNDRLAALPGSNLLAIGSGGTIPDRGSYSLVLNDRRTRVGDLDEEFVFETRPGDTFLLGSHVWRAIEITDDRVIAEPAPGEVPRMPFWHGDAPWRPYDLGRRVGAFRRELSDLVRSLTPPELDAVRAIDPRTVELGVDSHPLPLGESGGEGPEPSPIEDSRAISQREREGRAPGRVTGDDRQSSITSAHRRLVRFLCRDCALDRNSMVQAVDYVARQIDAVGQIATDRTVIVETFEDAIGDPRLVVHSPFGGRVNRPWGIVLAGAIRERFGVDAQVSSGDDGILLRFSNSDVTPPVDLVGTITSQEARERLLAELPHSATFGAQFRMNAARALLLPRERAGKRTPLWLSRLRAKDLLQAVQSFGDFPILLETFRDCLRDVLDLPGLTDVLDRIQRGEIEVVTHESQRPSPVALGLDVRFAMQYVYEYDAPRGERQMAALTLNRSLLADLLRDGSLVDVLKPEAIADVAARAGRVALNDRIRDSEELAQLLFELGDLSDDELQARAESPDVALWMTELVRSGRVERRRFGEQDRWVHAERRAEYDRIAERPEPVLARFLARSGPTSVQDLAERYALSPERVRVALGGLGDHVASGQFVAGAGVQWIDRRNLEQIHRRTLGLLRREVRPVTVFAYAEFLRRWHGVGSGRGRAGPAERGSDDPTVPDGAHLARVLQQLRGLAIPGAIWERDVLPGRVADFDPSKFAEWCQSGELRWVAEGGRDPRRARVQFFFRGEGALFLDRQPGQERLEALGGPARAAYEYLAAEGAALLADVAEAIELSQADARSALVELVVAGLATNDSLAALHTILGYEPPATKSGIHSALEAQLAALHPARPRPPSRQRLREARRHAREVVAAEALERRNPWVGRWSLVHRPSLLGKVLPDEERASRQTRQLLLRWGVVTRACLERESPMIEWSSIYSTLSRMELRGEVRRGYFVAGLPGLQFALPEVVEQLRAANREPDVANAESDPDDPSLVVLNAADPAQIFGSDGYVGTLRFQRLPSSAVAARGGEPVAVMEDGGAAILAVADHPALVAALRALAVWWTSRTSGRLKVERWQGDPVLDSSGTSLLEAAGFVRDYGGMLWPG